MLDGAQVSEVHGETVTLAVAASLAKRLAEERNSAVIVDAKKAEIAGAWKVVVVASGEGAPPADGASARLAPSRPSPPEPEPDPRDDTEPDDSPAAAATDPEAEALRLLQAELGARPVES
jgi:hypothetical protein